jgi:hypothetical protein
MLVRKVSQCVCEWVESGVSGLRKPVREMVGDLDSFDSPHFAMTRIFPIFLDTRTYRHYNLIKDFLDSSAYYISLTSSVTSPFTNLPFVQSPHCNNVKDFLFG